MRWAVFGGITKQEGDMVNGQVARERAGTHFAEVKLITQDIARMLTNAENLITEMVGPRDRPGRADIPTPTPLGRVHEHIDDLQSIQARLHEIILGLELLVEVPRPPSVGR